MSRPIATAQYRTIGILANQDAGRTTTAERLLAVAAGQLPARAVWHADNERAITLTSAATSLVWRGTLVNLITLAAADRQQSPGPLSVLDGAVLVIDATRSPAASVGASLAQSAGLARIAFVNKLDVAGADLASVLGQLTAIPGAPRALPVQLPIGALDGLIDLVTMRTWRWAPGSALAESSDIPAEWTGPALAARAALVDAVMPGHAGPSADELASAIRRACLEGTILPVLSGSAFRNRGIAPLLDAIAAYLPSPLDLPCSATGTDGALLQRTVSDEEPAAALAFRTVAESAGPLTFVRVYSGTLSVGATVLNTGTGQRERIGGLIRIHANHTESLKLAHTGDIVAIAGLTHTTTGDTLCDPAVPVILDRAPASARRA